MNTRIIRDLQSITLIFLFLCISQVGCTRSPNWNKEYSLQLETYDASPLISKFSNFFEIQYEDGIFGENEVEAEGESGEGDAYYYVDGSIEAINMDSYSVPAFPESENNSASDHFKEFATKLCLLTAMGKEAKVYFSEKKRL